MALHCALKVTVPNKNGKLVESELFNNLLSIAPTRRVAVKLYSLVKEYSKRPNWLDNKDIDDNGEITINSLINIPSFRDRIGKEKTIYSIDKNIGRFNKDNSVKKYLTYEDVKTKVDDFNKNNSLNNEYVATIETMSDSESHRIFYSPKIKLKGDNINYSIDSKDVILNESLNKRLEDILTSHNISIGTLNKLEKSLNVSGVTDFSSLRGTTEGIVELIRLADGIKGRKVLPEEFAHFAVEAMGEDLIKTRLINYIKENNLDRDIIDNYDTYYQQYEGDKNKLAIEALGKLLANSLLKQQELDYRYKGIKGLFTKFLDRVKSFLQSLNSKDINNAIVLAEQDANILAKNILTDSIPLDIRNITSTTKYLSTSEKVNRDREILIKIRNTEFKRLELYRKQLNNIDITLEQQKVLDDLQESLSKGEELEGLYSFLQKALDNLKIQNNNLLSIKDKGSSNIKESAKSLRAIRDYIYSYKTSISLLKEESVNNSTPEANRYEERFKILLNDTSSLIDELDILYNSVSLPIFTQFISTFVPQESLTSFKDENGKSYTVEDLIRKSDRDLGIFDRWLGAMADSADPIIQAYDQVVKKAKNKARREDLSTIKQIIKEQKLLEKEGIKDTSWMYVRDKNGNITGKYLTEIGWDKYNNAKVNMYLKVKELYGENPVGNDLTKANIYIKNWYRNNKENGLPKLSMYKSEAFSKLNKAQLRYYNFFMSTYKRLNSELPIEDSTDIIWVRKDLLERFKASKNIKEAVSHLGKEINEGFTSLEDDTHYGKISGIKDFEGREVNNLPIYYRTKFDTSEVSLDASSALIMYSSMASEYSQMKEVVDILEVGRALLREREITKTYKGSTLSEVFKYRGSTISSPITTKGDATKTMAKLNDLMSMQVYNKLMPDDTNVTILGKEISTTKLASQLAGATSLVNMSFNVLGGLANVTMGTTQMFIESVGAEYFGVKDMLKADKIYTTNIPGVMSDIGSRTPSNKLSLFMEHFNILQDHEKEVKEHDLDKKNRFSRLLKRDIFYFTYQAGEHFMQTRTALALANQYKLVDSKGNKVSLFDAMEVVYIDPNNKALGASLKIKEGYTKEDGTTFTDEDAYEFERKAYRINRKLHGTYNSADKNAIQKFALGRLALVFRKWIPDYIDRRYGKKRYDVELDQETEGYYRTLGRVLWGIYRKSIDYKTLLQGDTLTKHERANLQRAITEMGIFLSILLSIKALDKVFDDDDNPWLLRTLEYQLLRLYTEVGFGIPSPTIVTEGFTILKSPSATINTLEDIANTAQLFNPVKYVEEVQYGRYKGDSEAYRAFMQSPIVFPIRSVYRTLYPEEASKFFK